MKKYWFFLRILLIVYSWLVAIYTVMQAVLFILLYFRSIASSDSVMENNLRWFLLHPLAVLILLAMTIPGFLLSFWNDIIAWKEKRDGLYYRQY